MLLHLLITKWIHYHAVDDILINLLFLLLSAIDEKDIAFSLSIENPRKVYHIVSINEALIGILKLLFLLNPLEILVLQVDVTIERLIIELFI